MKECERCRAPEPASCSASFELFDFCAECSRNLCPACMELGCCGTTPAVSGIDADAGEDAERAEDGEA